jgi:hypothetical protein
MDEIPSDVWLLILEYLKPRELLVFQLVNKFCFKKADDWKLWMNLCINKWKGKQIKDKSPNNFQIVNDGDEFTKKNVKFQNNQRFSLKKSFQSWK